MHSPGQWQSEYYRDHALAGSTWDLQTGMPLSQHALSEQLKKVDYLLLGEVHDNLDHHKIQLDLLNLWLEQGMSPAVVFEQFDRSQQSLIDAHLDDLERLESETRFEERGWEWNAYKPLIKTARDEGLSVFAGNLSRDELKAMHEKESVSEFDDLLKPCLLSSAEALLKQDIAEAHCGMLNETMIDRMFGAQRLRDASLAQAMITAGTPSLMIAGNGHVRLDYGAGQILALNQDKRVLSIALVEVAGELQSLQDYEYLFSDGAPVFDIAIFTPRVRDEDPCETFKEQLKQIQHGTKPGSN